MPDKPYSLQCFPKFLVIVYLLLHSSEREESLFMMSEEHFENMYEHMEPVSFTMEGCLSHMGYVTFCFMGTLALRKKT